MRIPEVRRIRRNQQPEEAFPAREESVPEVGRIRVMPDPAPGPLHREAAPASAAVGWQKHITFGGRTAGGVNIPGGLRMPAVPEHSIRTAATGGGAGHPVVRPAPEPVGWDRNITFGGRTAGGVNIPGGLRAPVQKEAS